MTGPQPRGAFLDEVTVLLITWNEEDNLERTLAGLRGVPEIVAVDSGSTDRTLEILNADPRVRVVTRPFDTFARQCAFGLEQIASGRWVLSLDADHIVTPELLAELSELSPESGVHGFRSAFTYCVHGKRLRASLYPPRVVLFRKEAGQFVDDGHGHRVEVDGEPADLRGRILHDDRKPLARFLTAQSRYAAAEAAKLRNAPPGLPFADQLRAGKVLAPFAVLVYCLFFKGLIYDGWAGWHYTLQRVLAEVTLALGLVDDALRPPDSDGGGRSAPGRD